MAPAEDLIGEGCGGGRAERLGASYGSVATLVVKVANPKGRRTRADHWRENQANSE